MQCRLFAFFILISFSACYVFYQKKDILWTSWSGNGDQVEKTSLTKEDNLASFFLTRSQFLDQVFQKIAISSKKSYSGSTSILVHVPTLMLNCMCYSFLHVLSVKWGKENHDNGNSRRRALDQSNECRRFDSSVNWIDITYNYSCH